MLQVKNVTFVHQKDLRVLLKDFQLVLNPKDKAVIIGEEGNGKSTLMKWIYDPALVEDYIDAEGERSFQGERLGYLAQELPKEEGEKTVREYFEASVLFDQKTPRELALLTQQAGVESDFWYRLQLMKTLSGGEKVKAQLLRLLVEEPTILLLDEPSNDIDIQTLEWLETMIQAFPGAVLFISHDETLIERTANMVVHLEHVYRKRECRYKVAKMDYPTYRKERLNAFDKQEQQAQDDIRQKKIRDEKYRKIYEKVERDQANVSRQDPHSGRLLKKKMHAVKSLGRRFEKEDETMTKRPIVEEAINFNLNTADIVPIPAGKTVYSLSLDELRINTGSSTVDEGIGHGRDLAGGVLSKDIFLKVIGPEKVCIIGHNGAGKTTLLKQIWSDLQKRDDVKALYMPQNYEEQLAMDKTPVVFLAEEVGYEYKTKIELFLGALRFTFDEMAHPIEELSGGQKAKLFLLMMHLKGANVLILDEPTRNFSPLSGPVIRQMLREFPGALISVSHDRKYIREVCDTVYELTEGGLMKTEDGLD